MWNNIWAFLRKAGTIILLVSIIVWALSSLPGPDVEQSFLARFGQSLAPVGQLMGMDWRMIVALLSSFIAKENAIATLGILYGAGKDGAGFAETMSAAVSPATALSFLAVTMLFIPCVATVAVMHQETRSWRWTLFGVFLLLVIALSAGVMVYQCARWLGSWPRGRRSARWPGRSKNASGKGGPRAWPLSPSWPRAPTARSR
ncbi:MAG: nucleoside recognition domain-containing protein [Gammaproteobacteria bacterium]